jgi:hypothetical protein
MIFSDYRDVDGLRPPFCTTGYAKPKGSGEFISTVDTIIEELRILDAMPLDAFRLPTEK